MLKIFSHAAWRHITKNKISVILNITGLTIGIATCLIIAIWAERELSYDNFHQEADAKFRIWNTFTSEAETFSQAPSGVALGAQLPKLVPDIASSCRIFQWSSKIQHDTEVNFEQKVIIADSTFFSFFNFAIVSGKKEDALAHPDGIVLTRSTAIKYFGTIENALNKTLLMDDSTVSVSAIAEDPPINSHIQFSVVVPYSMLHSYALNNWKQDIDNMWVGGWPHTYIQVHDPKKSKDVERAVNSIVAEHSKKEWTDNKMSYQYFLQPIKEIHLHSALRYDSANNGSFTTVQVFIAVAILVLLLACFNYINLTTATSVKRAKEISLRKVVGAARFQLMRQFFTETFIVTVIAVLIGIALTQTMLPYFSSWMEQSYTLPLDLTHITILSGFVLIITLLAGMYPAIVLSSFQPIAALRGRFIASESGQTFRKALVILQFSISTVLLVSILTVDRQMQFIADKPLGYEGQSVLTIDFNGDQSVQKAYPAMRNELLAVPYIEETTMHNGNVVGGLGNGWLPTIDNDGKAITTSIYRLSADHDYFGTYKMKIIAGRGFQPGSADSTKAVLVNEAAVRNLGWKTPEDALGKPFGQGEDIQHVIGVVQDFHFENLHAAVQPLLILYSHAGNSMSIRVGANHITEAIRHIDNTWKKLAPGVPLNYTFIDESLGHQYANERKMEAVFYIFASLSFLIAGLGLFGLSTFMIRQRLQEISIRKVLGSSISGIVILLTKDFSKLVLLSVVVALPVGWVVMNEWLATFTYRTSIGWSVMMIALVLPLLICILTIGMQAIKAAFVNAARMLRSE